MLARNGFQRVAAPQSVRAKYSKKIFPAPVRGWITNETLADPAIGGAKILDNGFPTTTGVRIRKGASKHATIAAAGAFACESLFTYKSGASEKIFAAGNASIFDVTAPADSSTPPTAAVTGQSAGDYYSTTLIATAAGEYLYACNGSPTAAGNAPLLYDGSTWTSVTGVSTPAITGVTTTDLIATWTYRKRLYFVETGTQSAWYLPAASIGGAAQEISLSGVFKRGGRLLMGATWSLDSGDGPDDKCVFISTEGEIAVYEGDDPGASNWAQVGRYDAAPVMGKNAYMQAGGDLLIAVEEGIVPLSEVLVKDPAALSITAVSRNIEPEWKKEVITRSTKPWEMIKIPRLNMGVVSLPVITAEDKICYVVNLQTGAWGRYVGWDTQCMTLYADNGYFGTKDGVIYQMEDGGFDDTTPYISQWILQADHFGDFGNVKVAGLERSVWEAGQPFNPQVSILPEYGGINELPASPTAASDLDSTDVWDTGVWDTAVWDGGARRTVKTNLNAVAGVGTVLSPAIQVTNGSSNGPDAELVSVVITYQNGEFGV